MRPRAPGSLACAPSGVSCTRFARVHIRLHAPSPYACAARARGLTSHWPLFLPPPPPTLLRFRRRHQRCFSFVQSTRLAYTYTQPFVIATFYDTPNAGAFGSYKVLNLVEAGTELVRAATRIAAAPLADQ